MYSRRVPGPQRLFHAIVVLGTALSSCGGRMDRHDDGKDAEGNDGGVADASQRPADAGNTCEGSADEPEDCASPADFFCEYCSPTGRKCHCNVSAPDDPSACEKTQDYHCQSYEPMTGCRCVPGSPASESDCASPAFLLCRVEEPPIGCECITVITR